MVKEIPLINPPITGIDIYFTSFPTPKTENMTKNIPVHKVSTGTICNASSLPAKMPIEANVPPTNAAGAASTPIINWGDVERKANNKIGTTEPYNP